MDHVRQILFGAVEKVLESLRHKLHLVVQVDTVVLRVSIDVEFKFIFKILPGSTLLLPLLLRVGLYSRFQLLQLLSQTRCRQYRIGSLPDSNGLYLSRIGVDAFLLLFNQLIKSFIFMLSFLIWWLFFCLLKIGPILTIIENL